MTHHNISSSTTQIRALTEAELDSVSGGRKAGEGQRDFLTASVSEPTIVDVAIQIVKTIGQAIVHALP
jgi:hypothetical protein